MACITEISRNILSDCSTIGVGGLEVRAWIFNRRHIATITYDAPTNPSKITALTLSGGDAYTITGTKKSLNCGSDRVVADEMPDKFTHYFNFKAYEFASADVENLDALNDVVVVVESKDKGTGGDGTFRAFGILYGLYPSTDTMRANDLSGARNLELTSLSGQEEKYSQYTVDAGDYEDTIALLDGLLGT